MNYPSVKLSEVLRQRKEFITIDDDTVYSLCRVQTNRKGVVLRSITKGVDIKTKKQQICNAGEFIVATIDAKAGGYGFIPIGLNGAIVSSEYQLYQVNTSRLMPEFLSMIITTDMIQSQLRPIGTTNHARIYPEIFLNAEIPLPPLFNQQGIIDKYAALADEFEVFDREIASSTKNIVSLKQAIFKDAASGKLIGKTNEWDQVTIGSSLVLTNGRAFKPSEWNGSHEDGLPIIRIQNLNNPMAPFNYYIGEVDNRHVVLNGMLLFSWSGSKGSSFGPHIWRGTKAILNQHIFSVHHDHRYIKQFLYIALKNAVFEVESNLHGGVGIVHITKRNLERIHIPQPSLSDQQRTIDKVQGLLSDCAIIEKALLSNRLHAEMLSKAIVTKLLKQ